MEEANVDLITTLAKGFFVYAVVPTFDRQPSRLKILDPIAVDSIM